jgi:hypothetical protein
MLKMLHCCRNLPPLMKRDHMRERSAGELQNLAQLRCIELQCVGDQCKSPSHDSAQGQVAPLQSDGAPLRLAQSQDRHSRDLPTIDAVYRLLHPWRQDQALPASNRCTHAVRGPRELFSLRKLANLADRISCASARAATKQAVCPRSSTSSTSAPAPKSSSTMSTDGDGLHCTARTSGGGLCSRGKRALMSIEPLVSSDFT